MTFASGQTSLWTRHRPTVNADVQHQAKLVLAGKNSWCLAYCFVGSRIYLSDSRIDQPGTATRTNVHYLQIC